MNEDKTGLKIVLGVLGALAVIAALWRILAYEPQSAVRPSARSVSTAAERSKQPAALLEQAKRRELLGDAPAPVQPVPAAATSTPQNFMPYTASARPVVYPQNRASSKQPYPTHNLGGKRYVDTNFYTTDFKQPTAPSAPDYNDNGSRTGVGTPQVNFNSSTQARMQEERARMLAPYLRPNRKEKERMDAQWAKLSAAIDRAVLQALTPKSKREQNIEKYAAKNNVSEGVNAGFSGPYAPVGEAVAAQKQEVMKNFAQAFGSSAAQQAGAMMDQFSSELAGALSTPGVSTEQTTARVKEITQKYQRQMDKLAEKNQYDKFVAERVAQDNQQKEQLRAQYANADLNAKFSEIIDAAREKDLALATQHLPAEEYYKALYNNRYEAHSQLEQAVRQAGESLQPLRQWDNTQAQQQLEALQAREEAGQTISVARKSTPAEVAGMQDTLNRERTDLLKQVTQAYGEENARGMKQILDDYYNQMMQAAQQELSPADRQALQLKLRAESNRQLLKWQMDRVQEMNLPEDQKQAALEKLQQDYDNIK
ncbi:MAG: hypothetical protein IJ876_00020 [Elusimicrobiaceae bacterium]|nr:hypothetical protein [Elusimicrobiaceae bacterium]